jgi:tripartite-type tricarboxylate transporter receptor subunit TctC
MKNMIRLLLVPVMLAACGSGCSSEDGHSDAALSSSERNESGNRYPHDVVRLITHSSPGGGSDVFLRELARHLGPSMGVDFVVENVPGGGGARAMNRLANSPADGSVFYAATPSFIFTSLISHPASTYEDLDPIVNIFFDQEVIYTRAEGPFGALTDVIQAARSGRGRWGASTPGSLERQTLERLKQAADVDAAIVSHDGGGDLILNVLNGTLDVGVGEAQELRAQLASGQLRLLAVFSQERLPELPDVPTVKESGYDIVVTKFRGLMGPRDTPPEIVEAWENEIQEVLEDPDYRRIYSREMLSPAYMPQAEYARFIDSFATDTATFLRESGIID